MMHNLFAARSSDGVEIFSGKEDYSEHEGFCGRPSAARVMSFSANGEYFAYCDENGVHVIHVETQTEKCLINRPRTVLIQFSPLGTHISLWEPYQVKAGEKEGVNNASIYESETGNELISFRRRERSGCEVYWTSDESLCARLHNSEVHFYTNNDFASPPKRLQIGRIEDFRITTKVRGDPMVSVYVPGQKGQPSFVRLFKYPNFRSEEVVGNRSFYKADKVDMLWNNRGSAVIIVTATDTSADSYYGESGLHFLSAKGDSCLISRDKNGPVYHVEWAPSDKEFCVVYGFMPAKVTIYNLKCDPIFDFGTGARNCAYYNPFGNILAICGFGNLKGDVEFWDVAQKKKINSTTFSDTTLFRWAPDGVHVITATCAPRLRVGNGFKVWNYNGNLIYEKSFKELWEVCWRPNKDFKVKPIQFVSTRPTASTSTTNGQAKVYVPPALRGRPQPTTPKVRDDYEPPSNVRNKTEESMSKSALKNRKKREAKRNRVNESNTEPSSAPRKTAAEVFDSSGDPEKDKKIRNLRKKLRQIENLKSLQTEGKKLELNQLEKIKSEADVVAELKALEI
ncbi:DgyrCDS6221 [Dimorphilus gyrociliatus]|uniref:Eukaryotic translation initiation factor 2A n=1 Tax=Dimorphilus gyrociliatus TaxID=2664684 RepID=A0A7I8VMF1_9ANNE|nr:DgyrCDS6221 [Dimorphilus gyrociliatus]